MLQNASDDTIRFAFVVPAFPFRRAAFARSKTEPFVGLTSGKPGRANQEIGVPRQNMTPKGSRV
jgi:hypothetical protein